MSFLFVPSELSGASIQKILKDCKLEKSKTTNHLTRIWGKSKMKIELATIKQNQSGTRVPPANYPIEAALLL